MTDYDLSAGHLALAEENFRLRGLDAEFLHGDAETLPFEDATFDLVYSNGVIHHTPNTKAVVAEIGRVLKPGGKLIVMVYSEQSLHYWRKLVTELGLGHGMLLDHSMGEIMSRTVELSAKQGPIIRAESTVDHVTWGRLLGSRGCSGRLRSHAVSTPRARHRLAPLRLHLGGQDAVALSQRGVHQGALQRAA